jgi:hypothetical protein
MNTKTSWIMLGLVLLAATFVPIIPNENAGECQKVPDGSGGMMEDCDSNTGYVSIFDKFIGAK